MRQDVIHFWHVLEYLSPFDLRRELTESLRYFSLDEDCQERDFPWANPLKFDALKLSRRKRYKYKIYFGVFETEEAMAELRRVFGVAPPSFADPPSEITCLGSFEVGGDGYPAADTLSLSAMPWSVTHMGGGDLHAKIRDTQWADLFRGYRLEVYRRFFEDVDLRERVRRPFDAGLLADLCDAALGPAGWSPHISPLAYCVMNEVKGRESPLAGDRVEDERGGALSSPLDDESDEETSVEVGAGGDAQGETDILNSFYVQDLGRVFRALGGVGVGVALNQYMDETAPPDRKNLLDRRNLSPWCVPEMMPPGRWPSNDEKYQSLMQQVAINIARERLKGEGLFAVNGPPGTGKTTMLRDVIAHVVVERAERLAAFRSPQDAFTLGQKVSTTGGKPFEIYEPDPRMTGFEIVVASSNNGAVENVTRELPGAEAIGEDHDGRAAYFGEVAKHCLQPDDRGRPPWGLVAAVLGNRRNLREFANKFWFDELNEIQRGLPDLPPPMTIKLHLKKHSSAGWPEWKKAKDHFEEARSLVARLLNKRREWSRAVGDARVVATLLPEAEARAREVGQSYDEAAEALRKVAAAVTAAEKEQCDQLKIIDAVGRDRPHALFVFLHGLHRIFYNSGVADYEKRMREAQGELDEIRGRLKRQKVAREAAQSRLEECRVLLADADEKLQVLRTRRARNVETVSEGRARLGGEAFPDDTWWGRDESSVQLRAPWLDAELNRARAKLFISALGLHQTFIEVARHNFRRNLSLWGDMVLGRLVCEPGQALALWRTFFLVVPVVSTTFASVGRMFGALGRESLGWLLIDEAGQAPPQAAIGALWRSKRALVVGDPLQIEPVITLEDPIIAGIAEHLGVSAHWRPSSSGSGASAQGLADHATPYGGLIGAAPDALWVGCPLRVHRRCANPMFDISNTIAYEGIMFRHSKDAPPAGHPVLGESRWISVGGDCVSKNWVPGQGRWVLDMLAELRDNRGGTLPKVFIISPFRNVAYRLARMLDDEQQSWVPKGLPNWEVKRWLKQSVGTVHTFQGKEAPVVIFILGTDRRAAGARGWAAGKPNILNVAATRAQLHLYVVGDEDLWGGLPYFNVAGERLKLFAEHGGRVGTRADRS